MANNQYLPVADTKISSVDIPRFDGGLFLLEDQNAPVNAIVDSKDIELDINGYIMQRRRLSQFLPDTVQTSYQKFPVLWNNNLYYFTLDDGKAKFCQEGDAGWTDCGGSNSLTTLNGGFPTFLRVLDKVLIINGGNGDKLAYIDLGTGGFPVVKYTLVTDPGSALTGALTNLAAGSFNIYYAYSYSGAIGETLISPILTKSINIVRDQWGNNTATPSSIKVSRPAGAPPTGALYWNLYVAVAATGGTIQSSDMLQLAAKLDLSVLDFNDDGTLDINLGQPAPTANSTDGPRVDHGILEDGNPILFGDVDNPYAIWIGGGGPNALDFSTSNGGYKAEPEKGTNYYPTAIVGFRTGQGIPALTVLYSNTEGLSKQSVLQQQTITYGDTSFTVWGVTEQHYGAAGMAAPNSAINYNGKLLFLSTDGFLSADTQPTVQNVLSILPVSAPIDPYIRGIKNSAMKTVVGTGWNNKYMWLVPNAGFDTPQQIVILDTNVKGVNGKGAWYTLDIPANWIGVVSPKNDPAFVYIMQGNKSYKLLASNSTFDTKGGVSVPFATGATGALIGMGGEAHNVWQSDVLTMFYVLNLIGDITVGVNYRNQSGKMKTKAKTFHGPVFVPSGAGGWGDTGWGYDGHTPRFSSEPVIHDTVGVLTPVDKRIPIRVDDMFNEAQWFFYTPVGYSAFKLRAVSYEGVNLGVLPDLQ